jgi:hypothetical protein
MNGRRGFRIGPQQNQLKFLPNNELLFLVMMILLILLRKVLGLKKYGKAIPVTGLGGL